MRITLPSGKWRKRLKIKALPPFAELHKVRAGNYKMFLANYFGVTTDYLLGRTPFSISPDLFYKEIGNGVKISDLIQIISKSNTTEQKALSLVITKFDSKCNR